MFFYYYFSRFLKQILVYILFLLVGLLYFWFSLVYFRVFFLVSFCFVLLDCSFVDTWHHVAMVQKMPRRGPQIFGYTVPFTKPELFGYSVILTHGHLFFVFVCLLLGYDESLLFSQGDAPKESKKDS